MQNEMETPFAVVTGASSGIGLELAKQFAEHGFDLLVTAENEALDQAEASLRSMGVMVDAVRADLATYDGVETLYDRIVASGRPVDAIAINAGVGVGGPFVETDLDAELNLIALNVTSVVHLTKRVVKDMVARDEGRILFTSSIAAEGPAPYEAVYAASKAFVQSFSGALRDELRNTGITVTALQPGATETEFFHRAGMDDTKVGASRKSDPADVARQGFEALMAGKDHVVAAMAKEKAAVVVGQVMPESAKAAQHRKLSEPGSAKA
jgi:uncharacterized protein